MRQQICARCGDPFQAQRSTAVFCSTRCRVREHRDRHGLPRGLAFGTVLADPPWRFRNHSGRGTPEHHRLHHYATMSLAEIQALPIPDLVAPAAHCYLWVPNALLLEGLQTMRAWGFVYKTNLVWHKITKAGTTDPRGLGAYFRNATEILLFGTRGRLGTLPPARRQVNLLATRKREHSRKPDELYPVIEACSPGPYLELFARHPREGWIQWGNEIAEPAPRGRFVDVD